jgi:ParG
MRECKYARMEDDVAKKIPPGMTELSLYINKELKLRFKLACTAEEKPMSEVVTTLIEQWLTQKETPFPGEASKKDQKNADD